MKFFPIAASAAFAVFSFGPASAIGLDALTTGPSTVLSGPLEFSAFTYSDIEGNFAASSIDVTASSTSSAVTLSFTASGIGFSAIDDVFEILGTFQVGATDAEVTSITLSAASGNQRSGDSFYEFFLGTAALGSDLAIFDGISGTQVTDNATVTNLTSFGMNWDAQGEVFDSGAFLEIAGLDIVFGYTSTVAPPVPDVPLPSSAPLIIAGIGALAYLRRRK